MSFYATGWVWKNICQDPDRSSIHKLIMLCLANFANEEEDYSCNVKLSTLSKVTSLQKETISRNIQTLCKDGLLSIQKNFREDGGRKANTYQIPCCDKIKGGDKLTDKGVLTETTPLYIDISNKDTSSINETVSIETITPIVPKGVGLEVDFEEVWFFYPASKRGDKKRAKKKYIENSKKLNAQQIFDAVRNYYDSHTLQKGGDLEYLKLLSTFLNNDLVPWLTVEQHKKGEFDIKNFAGFETPQGTPPPQFNGRFLNPAYQIWLSEQQFKEDKDGNTDTSANQKYVN